MAKEALHAAPKLISLGTAAITNAPRAATTLSTATRYDAWNGELHEYATYATSWRNADELE